MADRFSLNKLVQGFNKRQEELSSEAAPRSVSDSDARDVRRPFRFEQSDYDRTEAPKDNMRKYWRQFETTPLIRKPITSFASRVTEAGYYIQSSKLDKDEIEMIGKWLDTSSVIAGQPNKNFRLLARKSVVQREVRGTALVEKAPHKDNNDKIAGLKLINPETTEAVTRPNQAILLHPDDLDDYPNAPKAESGGAAAWLQDTLETDQALFADPIEPTQHKDDDGDGDEKIGFRRGEVIPLRRDPDIGEVFGTSRIEAVADRVDGIKQKLDDNDEAIASKAYPLWLFMFGDPSSDVGVWESSDIQDFMSAQDMENFHPGMKQGVRGDVTVETISGEVADIAEYLDFDLRWIMSSMPMPIFTLGSFEGSQVGQIAGVAQQRDIQRQIKEARMELEEEFTPLVREIAQQQGIDKDRAESIFLRFGEPDRPDVDPSANQQVIRYISDTQGGRTKETSPKVTGPSDQVEQPSDEDGQSNEGQPSSPQDDSVIGGQAVKRLEEAEDKPRVPEKFVELWKVTPSRAELQNKESLISQSTFSIFRKVRDRTLDSVEKRFGDTPVFAAAEFENIANKQLNTIIREEKISEASREQLTSEVSGVIDEFAQNPTTTQKNIRFYSQSVENAVRDAAEEMLRQMRIQVRRGVVSGDSWDIVRDRVKNDYNDESLRQRANLIEQMESKSAIESTKMRLFKENDDIVGIKVHNPDATTPVSESLHGVQILFSEVDDVADELRSRARQERQGFDPLPETPPYHFQDTTQLQPIYDK